jgi:hypothetical protein
MGKSLLDKILDTAADVAGVATKYNPLIKTGISALSTYAAYKDQKAKNELQQAAYDDYMQAAAAAGKDAEAAVALNLTPMTVSGTPTTKAEVTDYTAATGLKHGGISSLRRGYAQGPSEFEVEEMDEEEIITPDYLMKEEGVNIDKQVFYNTGRGDRANALMIWDQMSTPDKSIFDFDFEIFFQDGGWRDMIKGEAPMSQGETQMASAPSMGDSQNEAAMQLFNKPYDQLNEMELQMFQEEMSKYMATGGIAGLRKKYAYGPDVEDVEMMDEEFVGDNELKMEEGVQIGPMAGGGDRGWRAQMLAEEIAEDQYGKEFYDLSQDLQFKIYNIALDMIDSGGEARGPVNPERPPIYLPKPGEEPQGIMMAAKGGRIRRANGGIMDMGGLEKDYRFSGGFVPIGEYEKKDDVPARLSKNEFVFTADAVRAAGGGSINKGAKRMYETMKNLEAQPTARRMTA